MFTLALVASLAAATVSAGVIQPVHDPTLCLDVAGANFADGTAVQLYQCNGTPAQNWTVPADWGSITVVDGNGQNWCLDRGSDGVDGAKLKIWQCYGRIPAQSWGYDAAANRIQNDDRVRCLDVTDGQFVAGNVPQTWTCYDGNTNQAWQYVQ